MQKSVIDKRYIAYKSVRSKPCLSTSLLAPIAQSMLKQVKEEFLMSLIANGVPKNYDLT